jgi:hypothetical protein
MASQPAGHRIWITTVLPNADEAIKKAEYFEGKKRGIKVPFVERIAYHGIIAA